MGKNKDAHPIMDKYDPKKNVLKVKQLELEDRVFDALKKGVSMAALERELESEGIYCSAQSLRKFVKKSKDAQKEIIQSDLKEAENFKKLAIDYKNAIKSILEEVEEVKNEAKDTKDYPTYNQLVGRLYQGLELFAKLTGDLTDRKQVDVNIIYQNINEDYEKRAKSLKEDIWDDNVIDVDSIIKEEDQQKAQEVQNT